MADPRQDNLENGRSQSDEPAAEQQQPTQVPNEPIAEQQQPAQVADEPAVEQQPEHQETPNALYAQVLPHDQRPVTPPVEEDVSREQEEETAPELPPRRYIDEEDVEPSVQYVLASGDDIMEFEEGTPWGQVRQSVIDGQPINPEDLVREGPVRDICDRIIQSKGKLSESQIEDIVDILNSNSEEIWDVISDPLEVKMKDFPVIGSEGTVTTLLHLAYACDVDTRIINAIEGIQEQSGYSMLDISCNLPAHYAAQYCSAEKVAHCFNSTGSGVINTRNFNNENPIDILVKNLKCSIEDVQSRLEYDIRDQNSDLWYSLRKAMMDGQPFTHYLVTGGTVREVCDKIIASKGKLSKSEVKNIVGILNSTREKIRDVIGGPLEVEGQNFPIVGHGNNITTLLHLAYAYNVDSDIIKAIEDVQGQGGYEILDISGNLPAHYAARCCSAEKIGKCFSKTASEIINNKNFNGSTPLHMLAQNPKCSEEELKIALENNLDPNITDSRLALPIHYVAENAKGDVIVSIIKVLTEDPEFQWQISALDGNESNILHYMVQNPSVDGKALKQVVNLTGMSLEQVDKNYKTPVGYAATVNNGKLIPALMKLNADINVVDNVGRTPLHDAVLSGTRGAVSRILKYSDVDCSKTDANGNTALHFAVEKQDATMVNMLLSLDKVKHHAVKESIKISLLSENLRGDTALNFACTQSDPKIVRDICEAIKTCYGEEMLNVLLVRENKVVSTLSLDQFRSSDVLAPARDLYVNASRSDLPLSPVHSAIRDSNIKVLKSIFESVPSKAILQQECSEGLNSCQLAALYGDASVLKFITENATSDQINTSGAVGMTTLHIACMQNKINFLKELVTNKHLDINQQMGEGQNTVLHAAIHRNDYDLLKRILNHPNIDVNVKNAEGKTALHFAAERGNVKIIKDLCRAGANINALDNNGRSVISSAITPHNSENEAINVVKALKGAKLDIDIDKNDLFQRCVECGYNKLLNVLVNAGARVHKDSQLSPITDAVRNKNQQAVSKLTSVGGNVNSVVTAQDSQQFGYNLLMIAVENSDLPMVKLLLSKGCDASLSRPDGRTAAHMLLDNQNVNFVSDVVKAIATKSPKNVCKIFSSQDLNGDTPLHLALKNSNIQAATKMIKSLPKKDLGNIASVQNTNKETLLNLAIKEGNVDFVKLLLKSIGSKSKIAEIASAKDEHGDTALNLAIKHGNLKIAQLILKNVNRQHLPNLMVEDVNGNTPLHQLLIKGPCDDMNRYHSIMKSMVNDTPIFSLTDITNTRNVDGNTPAHLALLSDNKYANALIKLCDEDVFLLPNKHGNLLSDCVKSDSKFRERRAYGFKSSVLEKILTLEKKARGVDTESLSSSLTSSSSSTDYEAEECSRQAEQRQSEELDRAEQRQMRRCASVGSVVGDIDRGEINKGSDGSSDSLYLNSTSSGKFTTDSVSLSSTASVKSASSTKSSASLDGLLSDLFNGEEETQEFSSALESIMSELPIGSMIPVEEGASVAPTANAAQTASSKKSTCHGK